MLTSVVLALTVKSVSNDATNLQYLTYIWLQEFSAHIMQFPMSIKVHSNHIPIYLQKINKLQLPHMFSEVHVYQILWQLLTRDMQILKGLSETWTNSSPEKDGTAIHLETAGQ